MSPISILFCSWHKSDIRAAPMNVCFKGQSGNADGVLYEYAPENCFAPASAPSAAAAIASRELWR